MNTARIAEDGSTIIFDESGKEIRRHPKPPFSAPPPVDKTWPIVIVPLKAFARPGDHGAGDIIARMIGPIGGDRFKRWYKALFGVDCGCSDRQDVLNARWPL